MSKQTIQKQEVFVPVEIIQNKIFWIRGHKVMIDKDLAELYEVRTFRLNEQVRRNLKRFPEDFMFQLSIQEKNELSAKCDRFNSLKHSTSSPYVFTEQGVAMLSTVLNSERAIEVNIQIMRTFAKLRELMLSHKDLAHKIEEMEKKYDGQFKAVFAAIRSLMTYPNDNYKRTKAGFITD